MIKETLGTGNIFFSSWVGGDGAKGGGDIQLNSKILMASNQSLRIRYTREGNVTLKDVGLSIGHIMSMKY